MEKPAPGTEHNHTPRNSSKYIPYGEPTGRCLAEALGSGIWGDLVITLFSGAESLVTLFFCLGQPTFLGVVRLFLGFRGNPRNLTSLGSPGKVNKNRAGATS